MRPRLDVRSLPKCLTVSAIVLAAAIPLVACLEGDPNPYASSGAPSTAVPSATTPTPSPTTSSTPSGSGGALSTSSPTDRIVFPGGDLPGNDSPRTVELWARSTFVGEGYFLAWGTFAAGKGFYVGALGGRLVVTQIGGAVIGTRAITDGQWHHLAVACSNASCDLYVDGTQDASGNLVYATQLASEAVIATTLPGENKPISAVIDEVRVWSVKRSASEIASSLKKRVDVGDPSLVLYFDMETSGTGTGIVVPQRATSRSIGNGRVEGSAMTPTFVPGVTLD